MATFDFVTGTEFRASLQADYAELQSAIGAGSWKSAHVLAGSIVEAILVDYLAASDLPVTRGIDPLTLDLGGAISICRQEHVLSDRAVGLIDVVRGFRNLIHPGRMIRLGETVDEDSARVAASLVEMVAKEVGRVRAETIGLTAEQLVTKLRNDSSSESILPHLLKMLGKAELERLLVAVLPNAYVAELDEPYTDDDFLERLEVAYGTGFVAAPEQVRKQAAIRYVTVLRDEIGPTVAVWEARFFRSAMLDHLPKPDADMVKAHLLDRLGSDRSVRLIQAAHGLSRYLDAKELGRATDVIVNEIVYGTNGDLDKAVRELIADFQRIQSAEQDQVMLARLRNWVTFLKEKRRPEAAQSIETLAASLDEFDDLPF